LYIKPAAINSINDFWAWFAITITEEPLIKKLIRGPLVRKRTLTRGAEALIKHIVMWKLKDSAEGNDRRANAQLVKEKLEVLNGLVPGMLELEVGLGIGQGGDTCDIALYSTFSDEAALAAYQDHPDHKAVFPFIVAVRETRTVIDYVVE
jgi:hypothetical protein